MSTPGKPRQSGIPGPGRTSSIPTPGRSRSSSNVYQPYAAPVDVEYMSRAFADAIKANDPTQHRPSQTNQNSSTSLSPQSISTYSQSGRRSVAGRPSSVASTSSLVSSTSVRERAKTPTSTRPPSRPPSRHSDVFGKTIARTFEIGDNVRIESLGYEGTLRYVGEIEGKLGLWAGVELSGGFSGKGKNNGTVNG
jgi:CAP-Gly domain-containing linker protein 1